MMMKWFDHSLLPALTQNVNIADSERSSHTPGGSRQTSGTNIIGAEKSVTEVFMRERKIDK